MRKNNMIINKLLFMVNYYYKDLNRILDKIKEEKIEEPIILHTNQGSVCSSIEYNNLLNNFSIQHSMSCTGIPIEIQLINHLMIELKKNCLLILI